MDGETLAVLVETQRERIMRRYRELTAEGFSHEVAFLQSLDEVTPIWDVVDEVIDVTAANAEWDRLVGIARVQC